MYLWRISNIFDTHPPLPPLFKSYVQDDVNPHILLEGIFTPDAAVSIYGESVIHLSWHTPRTRPFFQSYVQEEPTTHSHIT